MLGSIRALVCVECEDAGTQTEVEFVERERQQGKKQEDKMEEKNERL